MTVIHLRKEERMRKTGRGESRREGKNEGERDRMKKKEGGQREIQRNINAIGASLFPRSVGERGKGTLSERLLLPRHIKGMELMTEQSRTHRTEA